MAADSFKITDRRSSHEDEENEEDSQKSAPAPSPKEQGTLEPPPSSPERPLTQGPRPAQSPIPPTPEPENLDFPDDDDLPDEGTETPQDDSMPRGRVGGTPFSMRPIEIAHSFIGVLVQKAWVSLGLMPNPETGAMSRNLEDARETIELLEVLTRHFSGKWGMPGLEAELQSQLSNLRLQFARLKGVE